MTVAKGLGNGFPVGAMLGKKPLIESFQAGSHGSTFGGNPLGMAIVKAVLDIYEPAFLTTIRTHADEWVKELKKRAIHMFYCERHPWQWLPYWT